MNINKLERERKMRKYFKLFLTALFAIVSLFFGMENTNAKVKIHFVDMKEGYQSYVMNKSYDMVNGQTKTLAMNQIFAYGDSTRPYTGLRYATSTTETDKPAIGTNLYEFIGWFDGEGEDAVEITPDYVITDTYAGVLKSLVTLSKTDANKPNALKISVNYADENEDVDVYFYARWKTYRQPVLNFNYVDKVSTGSGSWGNENGSSSTYSHTFRKPDEPNNYQFLYWKLNEDTYGDGDTFTYDLSDKGYNFEETLTAYAWWQSSVTLNLHVEGEIVYSDESFESVSIPSDINPTKEGYDFVGWVDEKGNEVTETAFAPLAASYEKVTPKEVNLYANFKKQTVTIDIVKNWVDNDNAEGLRPDSIEVIVYANNDIYERVTLNDENNWSTSLIADKYDDQLVEIQYRLEEVKVDDYDSKIENYEITNTIKEKGKVVVKYVEKETKEELDSTTLEDYVDRKYETKEKEIENYEYLNEIEGSAKGTFTKEDIVVTYYYKAILGKVIVKYVDVNGKSLADDILLEGKIGKEFEAKEKDFEMYVLKETKGEVKGKFSKDNKEVIFVYEEVGVGGDDIIDNTPEVVPPQTGISYDIAPCIITIISCLGLAITKKYTFSE
jgi:uncharacterized repeat protein (TIGR02543 family)